MITNREYANEAIDIYDAIVAVLDARHYTLTNAEVCSLVPAIIQAKRSDDALRQAREITEYTKAQVADWDALS